MGDSGIFESRHTISGAPQSITTIYGTSVTGMLQSLIRTRGNSMAALRRRTTQATFHSGSGAAISWPPPKTQNGEHDAPRFENDQTCGELDQACLRRRTTAPIRPRPASNIANDSGSGTGVIDTLSKAT